MKLGSIIYVDDLLLLIVIIKYSIKSVLVSLKMMPNWGGGSGRQQSVLLRAGLPSRETSASWRNGPTETIKILQG